MTAVEEPDVGATVYRMYDANDQLLYVGCSVAWPQRAAAHQDKPWWREVARMTLQHFEHWSDALAAESAAQASESPRHNVVGNRKSMKGYLAEKREQKRQEREAQRAELASRGVYGVYMGCKNCGFRGTTEVPLGTLKSEARCPDCGVARTPTTKAVAA